MPFNRKQIVKYKNYPDQNFSQCLQEKSKRAQSVYRVPLHWIFTRRSCHSLIVCGRYCKGFLCGIWVLFWWRQWEFESRLIRGRDWVIKQANERIGFLFSLHVCFIFFMYLLFSIPTMTKLENCTTVLTILLNSPVFVCFYYVSNFIRMIQKLLC